MPDPQMPLRLSVDALKRLFAYDTQAALGLHTRAVWATAQATVHDLVYASPKGGLVPALLVVPDGPGPFAGVIIQLASQRRAPV
jgi:hypothetical protein